MTGYENRTTGYNFVMGKTLLLYYHFREVGLTICLI